MPKSKTHFPEVPIELAEQIAKLETTNEEPKADRGEQLRAAVKKRRIARFPVSVDVEGEQK